MTISISGKGEKRERRKKQAIISEVGYCKPTEFNSDGLTYFLG